jgi:hypothetical protein
MQCFTGDKGFVTPSESPQKEASGRLMPHWLKLRAP